MTAIPGTFVALIVGAIIGAAIMCCITNLEKEDSNILKLFEKMVSVGNHVLFKERDAEIAALRKENSELSQKLEALRERNSELSNKKSKYKELCRRLC